MGGLSDQTLNYVQLALVYDAIMGDPQGVICYARMLSDFLSGNKVLDLACGTGDLTRRLHDMGYRMTGLDVSEPMLKIARNKVSTDEVRFVCMDMLDLGLNEIFDSVVCANDSINYCRSLLQLKALFTGVNRHLVLGGPFIFDVHMESRLKEFSDPFEEEGVIDGLGYHWLIESEPPILRHTVTIYGRGYPVVEVHEQTVFELKDILSLLTDCGFRWTRIDPKKYDDLYLDEKYMICAIKEREL